MQHFHTPYEEACNKYVKLSDCHNKQIPSLKLKYEQAFKKYWKTFDSQDQKNLDLESRNVDRIQKELYYPKKIEEVQKELKLLEKALDEKEKHLTKYKRSSNQSYNKLLESISKNNKLLEQKIKTHKKLRSQWQKSHAQILLLDCLTESAWTLFRFFKQRRQFSWMVDGMPPIISILYYVLYRTSSFLSLR